MSKIEIEEAPTGQSEGSRLINELLQIKEVIGKTRHRS